MDVNERESKMKKVKANRQLNRVRAIQVSHHSFMLIIISNTNTAKRIQLYMIANVAGDRLRLLIAENRL